MWNLKVLHWVVGKGEEREKTQLTEVISNMTRDMQ